ncbi:MAG: hypothetical protein FWE05_04770 [Defluviitaleaceae bacterium]|nr:hypothetical protein [Defluviitaleaceae bacterium]
MIDPMSLPTHILGGIMQNFPAMPIVQNPVGISKTEQNDTANRVAEVGGSIHAFSEALAERIAEISVLESDKIRGIINEELTAVVGENSTEIVTMLNHLDNGINNGINDPMALFTSLMSEDRSDIMTMLNMLTGNNNPMESNPLDMIMNLPSSFSGMANPSAMYNQILRW